MAMAWWTTLLWTTGNRTRLLLLRPDFGLRLLKEQVFSFVVQVEIYLLNLLCTIHTLVISTTVIWIVGSSCCCYYCAWVGVRCVGGPGWSGGGQSSIMVGGGIHIVFSPCTYHGDSNVTVDPIPDHRIVTVSNHSIATIPNSWSQHCYHFRHCYVCSWHVQPCTQFSPCPITGLLLCTRFPITVLLSCPTL